jgi:beta-1,4-mannosyl-glycoprotein beta-1,4-N-acetylglucosaminyltransferase
MSMIIDCFPFFNELEVLELRLNILDEVVDKFVLVESSLTQTGIKKPFYFEKNKEKYSKFLHKIVHIKLNDTIIDNSKWAIENFQRNCIQRGLDNLNLNENDIIGISDVDEIWNPKIIKNLNMLLFTNDFVSISMNYFVFFLNLETCNKKWIGTIFTKFENLKVYSPQNLRNIKDRVVCLENSGWHFGYQGGKEVVYNKYLSCVEPIDKNLLPSKEMFFEQFDRRIKDGGNFIFSDDLGNDSIKLKKIPISEESLPIFIVNNQNKYEKMLIK